jgi:hypothetical protein
MSTSWSRRVVVEMQVVVEEGVDVVRSGAVEPLDADAIMFSDPYGELADDTGVQVAFREVVLLLLLHGEAPRAGRAAVSLVRPTQGQNFCLAPFCRARTLENGGETHCPKVRDEIARFLSFLTVSSDPP